jgi:hypothetical protein
LPIWFTETGNLTGGTQQIVPVKASCVPPVRFYRGIRPRERRKGYAKVILNNGGVFENEVVEDTGQLVQRYWITLR